MIGEGDLKTCFLSEYLSYCLMRDGIIELMFRLGGLREECPGVKVDDGTLTYKQGIRFYLSKDKSGYNGNL